MDEYTSQEVRIIRLATAEALQECGNDAYMEARGTIELLLEEVASYKTRVATLKEVLESTMTITLKAAEARTSAAEEGDPEGGSASLLPLGKHPEALSREQYPAVKYWKRADYNRARRNDKGNTNALATARPKRGRPRVVADGEPDEEDEGAGWDCQDPNKMPKHPYIETVDGRPASRETLCAIGIKARRIWQSMAAKGVAPASWGQVTDRIYNYYTQEMLNGFIEFRLCDNDWKLQMWTTRSYSSWIQNRLKLKAKKENTNTNIAGQRSSPAPNSDLTSTSEASRSSTTNFGITGDAHSTTSSTTTNLGTASHVETGPSSGANSNQATQRRLNNPSDEDEFPEDVTGGEDNREANERGDGGNRGEESEEPGGGDQETRGNDGATRNNLEGDHNADNHQGTNDANDQGTNDANDQGDNRTNGEIAKRAAQGALDGRPPSKRQKKPPALAIPGQQNTERNFAMRAWAEKNPGGFKIDFDAWYKKLSAQELQPFSEAAKAARKKAGKTKN